MKIGSKVKIDVDYIIKENNSKIDDDKLEEKIIRLLEENRDIVFEIEGIEHEKFPITLKGFDIRFCKEELIE